MKASGKETARKKDTKADMLRILKHDISNQLSNIYLALEQLRYEIPEASEDCTFYLESIAISSAKIDTLLKASN
jgi:hypothetical protein